MKPTIATERSNPERSEGKPTILEILWNVQISRMMFDFDFAGR
jgi:hypothetical protein